MSTVLSYKIHTVTPYINWIYFFHAWGFQPRYAAITNIHGCDACRAMWLASFPVEERNKASDATVQGGKPYAGCTRPGL